MKLFIFFTAFFVGGILLYRYEILAGALADGLYPTAADSPYLLPWESGEPHYCFFGNNAWLTHQGRGRFAWDFLMPMGTKILAAREGKVVSVVDQNEGRGVSGKPNNEIDIDHGDGTLARYYHMQKGGSRVKVGDIVKRGQVIALSGDVGKSLGPHLHFEVVDQSQQTVPIAFRDVTRHQGVPRASFFYTSSNRLD